MPRPLLFAALWCLAGLPSPAAAEVQVRAGHPRIYLRPGDAAEIRQRVDRSSMVRGCQYLYYLRRPSGRLAPKGNENYQISLSDKHLGALGALASARYSDSFGERIKDLTFSDSSFGLHQTEPVLWYRENVEELDDQALPRSMHFQGQGEVIIRSAFRRDDTWVYLHSGPVYNGHQHDHQGNLLIEAYGGELFVENAGNERYATSHHNTLRVGGDQLRYGNSQIQYVQPIVHTRYERGRIADLVRSDLYHYAAADMSNAYSEATVPAPCRGQVTREVVVILPDIVVVRDRIDSSADAEFLLHTWNRPRNLHRS